MKKQKIIFLIFGLLIIATPIFIMLSSEDVLTNGHRHKLRLEGRDPFDPFRGKYIRLNINSSVVCPECEVGDDAYITLEKDSLGYSYFSNGYTTKPEHNDYFIAEVETVWENKIWIKLDNLTKFFINEDKAKDAETILWDYQANRPDDLYLAIRVLDGEARLEDIFIEETPLLEFLNERKD